MGHSNRAQSFLCRSVKQFVPVFLLMFGAIQSPAVLAEINIEANVSMASNYIWRGLDQSNNNPVIQGGYDLNLQNGLYGGVWASNVSNDDPSSGNNVEADLYVGLKKAFGDFGLDLAYLRYEYPKASSDFKELFVQGNYKGLSAAYYYKLTDFEDAEPKAYFRTKADINLPGALGLTVAVGRTLIEGEHDDVVDAMIGISKAAGDLKLGLAISTNDIDYKADDDAGDDSTLENNDTETDFITVSVSKSF